MYQTWSGGDLHADHFFSFVKHKVHRAYAVKYGCNKVYNGRLIFSLHEFFFRSLLVQEFFFQVSPSARIFFFRQILLFFEQWNLDSLSMFLCFINYSTLTTDQRIQATLMQNLFENVHTVREEEATWSGRLPCAFFQSLPSGIPLPQPIKMMPYSIHQNSPSVVPSTPKCQSKKKVPV